MTRARIIADLMACLRAMGPDKGLAIAPAAVKRGIHLAAEANQMPFLSLYNQRVETTDAASNSAERLLTFHLWGSVRAAQGDYSQLDALAAACLETLARPDLNPHWQRTACGRLELYEGGAGDPLGLFDLEFTVAYESPLAVL